MLKDNKTKFSAKGQIQSGELVLIVIIVMLFLVIGLAAYSNFKSRNIAEISREFESLDAIDLAQEALSLPELKCSFTEEASSQCLDVYRLNQLVNLIQSSPVSSSAFNYYRSQFGQAKITVEKIYPEYIMWDVYELGEGDETPVRIPVYLYDPVKKTNSFGIITVVKYS